MSNQPFAMLAPMAQIIELALIEMWDPTTLEFADWVRAHVSEIELEYDAALESMIVRTSKWRMWFDVRNLDANYNPFIKERIAQAQTCAEPST